MRIVTGFHAIEETVRSARREYGTAPFPGKILYSREGPRTREILSEARQARVPAEKTEQSRLDSLVRNLHEEARDHRGIILILETERETAETSLDDFLRTLEKKDAVAVILDGITDPHNIGAIMRSCDQFGADIVIVPSRGSAKNGEVTDLSRAGASSWVPTATVPNLTQAAEKLKNAGFWIYGADAAGTSLCETRLAERTAVVMGSEGSGISRLLKKTCDTIVSIPTCGKLDSLNVSVAAGVILYEIRRQRLCAEKRG